jgi:hypothetical protein
LKISNFDDFDVLGAQYNSEFYDDKL